jgi:predicted alpha/beta hydrolase family esterase
MQPLVIVVHAFGGSPKKFWYSKLAEALVDDARVEVLRMTDPATPRIAAWVGDLERRAAAAAEEAAAAKVLGRAVYFVGHSVGCQAIVRYLATPAAASLLAGGSLRLGGVLCVAAWFSVIDPWAKIEPWCTTPIDTDAARRLIESHGAPLVVLVSDDDRYTPDHAANATAWHDRLGARTRTLSGARHFGGRRQPHIVAAVRALLDLDPLPGHLASSKAHRPSSPG